MKAKVVALLIKHGHTEKSAASAVDANLDLAMRSYPQAKASFLADVCIAL